MRVSKLTPILAVVALASVVFAAFSFDQRAEPAQPQTTKQGEGWTPPPFPEKSTPPSEAALDDTERALVAMCGRSFDDRQVLTSLNEVTQTRAQLSALKCPTNERAGTLFLFNTTSSSVTLWGRPTIAVRFSDGTNAELEVLSIQPRAVVFADNGDHHQFGRKILMGQGFVVDVPLEGSRGAFSFRASRQWRDAATRAFGSGAK